MDDTFDRYGMRGRPGHIEDSGRLAAEIGADIVIAPGCLLLNGTF